MDLTKRLLHQLLPLEYDIVLRPDLLTFTFSGEETLRFSLKNSSREITLHAQDLVLQKAYLFWQGKRHEAKISYSEKNMTVTLEFAKELPIGEHTLEIAFTGKIGEQLKGWYKSSYTVGDETRHMATTQFEEIGARKVFPSIDDPSAKAVFRVSFVIPSHLTAISNTIDTHVVEHESGFQTVTFAPTPKMATYALAFIVGEFEYVEGVTTTGVKVRVFVTPGKKSQAKFALETTLKMLPFYEKYFDIAYPLPVMDLIAIPDFDAGAMENWGAITAREVALLVDEEQTSAANKQWVATVIAHELTHMWFGNLVTMHWWSDLWLNEGFASYMEYVGVNEFFPEWKVWEQFAVLDHNRALGLDGLENTHPIQSHIEDVEKIAELFDDVSYAKGASVIQMLSVYLGDIVFRDGLRLYLKKHAYGNAQTSDLWEALEEVSGKQITEMMGGFTEKPGYPLVSVSYKDNAIELSQTRFFSSHLSREKSKDTMMWSIPLGVLTNEKEETLFLDKKMIIYKEKFEWIKINRQETSFARVIYDKTLYQKLTLPLQQKTLSSIDRMGLIRDAFDSAESSYTSVVDALNLLENYKNEDAYIVWAVIGGKLGKVENLLTTEIFEKKFNTFIQSIFSSVSQKVGWKKKTTDSHTDILLRSLVLSILGTYKDKGTLAKAKEIFKEIMKNKHNVDTDIRGVVYATVAGNGDEKQFEDLRNLYIHEEMSSEKNRIGAALCLFKNPEIIQKVLEFSLSKEVRSQDIGRFIVGSFNNKKGREVTWEFVKTHWDSLLAKMEGLGLDWIIEGATSVVSQGLLSDMKDFFAGHHHPKLEKTMKQVIEQIESNLDWQQRDGEAIEKFLSDKI